MFFLLCSKEIIVIAENVSSEKINFEGVSQ